MLETGIISPARQRLNRLRVRLGLSGVVHQSINGFSLRMTEDGKGGWLGGNCAEARAKLRALATPYKEARNAS